MKLVVFEGYRHFLGIEIHHDRFGLIRVGDFIHDLSLDIRSGLAQAAAGGHKPDEYNHQE
jgi:hypothetical protein